MRHVYQAQQWVPFSPGQVFLFFSDPRNLPPLMPRWQRARIAQASLTPPPPRPEPHSPLPPGSVIAGSGTTMLLTFRAIPLLPVRLKWHAEIAEFVWNDHFCDVQNRGPFRYWKHCHRVESHTGPGGRPGSLISDHVTYEFPAGRLGDLANRLGGRWQIGSIFRYRHRRTEELLPPFVDHLHDAASAANRS